MGASTGFGGAPGGCCGLTFAPSARLAGGLTATTTPSSRPLAIRNILPSVPATTMGTKCALPSLPTMTTNGFLSLVTNAPAGTSMKLVAGISSDALTKLPATKRPSVLSNSTSVRKVRVRVSSSPEVRAILPLTLRSGAAASITSTSSPALITGASACSA